MSILGPRGQSHGHGTYKGFYSCCGLIVAGPEATPYILIIKDLHLKSEVFFQLNEGGVTFLMIMTRKGSLMARVFLLSTGQVI